MRNVELRFVLIAYDQQQPKIVVRKTYGGNISIPYCSVSAETINITAQAAIRQLLPLPHNLFTKQAGWLDGGNKLTLVYSIILPTTNALQGGLEWMDAQELAKSQDKLEYGTMQLIDLALRNGSRTY